MFGFIAFFIGVALMTLTPHLNGHTAPLNTNMPVLFGLTIWVSIWIIIHAANEAGRTIRGFHWKRGIYRTIVAMAISVTVGRFDLMLTVALFVYQATLFGVVFDPFRNYFANIRGLLYRGSEAFFDGIIPDHDVVYYTLKACAYFASMYWMIMLLR